jgi:HAE1 family hydrophobic/amphiphilic exporter-1
MLIDLIGKVLTILIVLILLLLVLLPGLAGVVLFPIAVVLLAGFERAFGAMRAVYPSAVRWGLNHRLTVLVPAGLFLVACWFVLLPGLGRELIPEVHQGEFTVEVTTPVGTPIETTDQTIRRIETTVMGLPDVRRVASIAGVEKSVTTSSDEGEHTGKIIVTLKNGGDLVALEDRAIDRLRRELTGIPETTITIARPVLFSFKTPVEVEVRGYNLDQLRRISSEVEERMKGIEHLYDVKATIRRGHPEVRITYDRNLLTSYGLNIYDVASLVRSKVEGNVPTRFKGYPDREIDILVRVEETYREGVDDLKRLVINPGSAVPIPLMAVARIEVDEGPSEIRRIDQQRAAVIRANIGGRDLASVTRDTERVVRTVDIPRDFTFEIGGQNREMEVSLRSLKFALILAVFLVYVVMASQFESLLHPFVIMFTIPLAAIGVVVVLFALSLPLSVMVFIGMILLAGIVVNNAIVLVDYINQLRRRGMEKMEAIITAGRVRLRPIMMTTGTTVLGLLPMALGLGEGAELRMPLAVTVIAGLASSTLLTLIVIPVVYSLVDRTP